MTESARVACPAEHHDILHVLSDCSDTKVAELPLPYRPITASAMMARWRLRHGDASLRPQVDRACTKHG